MNKTEAFCKDPIVLRGRVTVNDSELPYLLGMGRVSSRKFADACGATIYIGRRKAYSVSKLIKGAERMAL